MTTKESQKGSRSILKSSFLECEITSEFHVTITVSLSWSQFQRYPSNRDSVQRIHWHLKQMIYGHISTGSHNCARWRVVNHDWLTQLQTEYNPTLPIEYTKLNKKYPAGSTIHSQTLSHLPAASYRQMKRPIRRSTRVDRDVISVTKTTWTPLWCSHYISEFWNLSITFS